MRFRQLCIAALMAASTFACGAKRRPAKGALPPLTASSWLIGLPNAESGEAKVAVPLGAVKARPLLIALHGEVDRPEWQCGSYRGITHGRSFILCPSGPARAALGGVRAPVADTARELRAEIAALKAKFGAHLARGSVVLAALGPTVEQALTIALEEPSFFSRLVLVNGSLSRLDAAFATRYGQLGGERVLVVCSRGACDADADTRARSLRPSGVEVHFVVPERGEGLDGEIARVIEEQWPWLVGSDSRWR
ncbi:MAG TPA: hypothetical protein VFQ35_15270 [Polyangiaceae bacterium]|nr:hypothetical protein [Polyangiaceae bacterium]